MDSIAVEESGRAEPPYDDPFVRWWVDPASVSTTWRYAGAVALAVQRGRSDQTSATQAVIALGDSHADLAVVLGDAAATLDSEPDRLTIPHHGEAALPAGWSFGTKNVWDAMWTDAEPPQVPGEDAVELLDPDAGPGAAEIDALLDQAYPDSHGRPGEPGIRQWAGVRDGTGALVAAGALTVRAGTGIAHLRGISTLASARGRGLATAISAALTRIGLAGISPVVTLGVYSDNEPALAVYRRLGYRHLRSLLSGRPGGRQP